MTTIRISHQKQYTCIANQAIRDPRLSYKARGVHHLLLSYPDDWIVNITHLVNGSDNDGRDAVRSGLSELERYGYLVRNRMRTALGRFSNTTYTVYEFPMHKTVSDSERPQSAPQEEPCTENPQTGISTDGKSADGKSDTILNTDIRSTDLNEVIKHEVTISPPTPSTEVGSRNSEVRNAPRIPARTTSGRVGVGSKDSATRSLIESEPKVLDDATTFVDRSCSIQPHGQSNTSDFEKSSAACSTQVTRKSTDGIFGAKPSTLALQKEKAKQEAVGGYFESFETRQAFFGQLQGFLKAINPTWEPGKVRGTAIVQTNRLNAGKPNAEDEEAFQMFMRGELEQYQNSEYDHQATLRERAEQKRRAKDALYAKYDDPTKVRSKLLM